VAQGGGWLATLYLGSGGGSVATGMRLAELTRMFWLKSISPNSKSFIYQPDLIPHGVEATATVAQSVPGLAAYRRSVQAIEQSTFDGKGRCASACSFIHVAGIERRGTMHVHRSKPGKSQDPDEPIIDEMERLQQSEARIVALYRRMDTSEATVETFRATPAAKLTPTVAMRSPRYVADALRRRCKADPGELEEQEAKLVAEIAQAIPNSSNAGALRTQLAKLQMRRIPIEQCAAAVHEKERLAQFGKYCANGCDRSKVLREVNDRIKASDGRETARR
jgi:hypothetical protein